MNEYEEAAGELLSRYPNIKYVESTGDAEALPHGLFLKRTPSQIARREGPRRSGIPTLISPKPNTIREFFRFCHELGHLVEPKALSPDILGPQASYERAASAFAVRCFREFSLELPEGIWESFEKYHKTHERIDTKRSKRTQRARIKRL